MHLKLKDQQLKTVLFIYRPLYQNFMETTNQKSTIDEKKKKNQPTHKEKQSKTTLKLVIKSEETRTKEEKRLTKTNPKQLTKWQ